MITIFICTSILIAFFLYRISSTLIDIAENDILDTAKSIEDGVTRRNLPLWFSVGYMVTTTIISYQCNNDYIFVITMIILSAASIIDMIRNWVPDLIIFLTISLSFMGNDNNHLHIIATCIITLLPFLVLNLISLKSNQRTSVASGDLYIIAALSIWLSPFTSPLLAALTILSATVFSLKSKNTHIPLVPFIQMSFLITYAIHRHLL
ncbi:hypothetical protein GQG94_004779 [Salmonella enterica]|nr:hypothetical protein [Salmonella enterica subsp. enterica serovar Mbandaka]EEJ1220471.1 hypothetical protein [Salmonella enterica]ELK3355879.1 prepilin peptidase [Salmonella enterica]